MSISVTLICPIYSSLKSLSSLLKQINSLETSCLYQFELIILNDSSPILLEKDINLLLRKFPNEINLKYLFLEKNIGAGSIRNLGISLSNSSKYIGFLDDDDMPDLKNILNTSTTYDVDMIISPLNKYNSSKDFFKIYKSRITLFNFFLKGNIKTVAWNKLYNLEFIKTIKAKFSSYRLFEDELFLLNILSSKEIKKFILINRPFVNVYKRKDSRSRSFSHLEAFTYFLVQIENMALLYHKSLFFLSLWLIFFFPKSIISFLLSYLRSFYRRRILYLFIK